LHRQTVIGVLVTFGNAGTYLAVLLPDDPQMWRVSIKRRRPMIRLKLVVAALFLSAAAATPVLAGPTIQEPGAYAFYYPYGDLGIGSSRPAEAMASSDMARLRNATMSHPLAVRRARPAKPY
jgi:hypothetical protein